MGRPHRLTIVALILAAVALITAIAVGGVLSSLTAANDAARAKDVALALAYTSRHEAINECVHDNNAALARIAAAEAIIRIAVESNPLRPALTPEQVWLTADFVKRENEAIKRANPLHQCTLVALGLPKLPPLTPRARQILEAGVTTSTVGGKVGTVTSVAPSPASTVGRRPTTTVCGCNSTTTHCVKKANRGTCRGKP